MKKLGKIIAFVGVAGAALAGLWYFLDNVKGSEEENDCDAEEKDVADEERSYVSLDPVSEENKETLKKVVTDGADYATELGMYVLIDWHILHDLDPNVYKEDAKVFFDEMSLRYANNDNVIYEICNEPNGNTS